MPLPLPNLDDRRWADLVDESRALIPRYAPGWTDHNIHDPGITLLELFAWLSEMSLYRLNQIPDRHRRKFLALTGFRPQPPQASQTVLAFKPPLGFTSVLVPAGLEFEASGPHKRSIPFRTRRDLTVALVTLTALQVDAGDGVLLDRTMDWQDGLPIAALGQNPEPGAALYLGFSELPVETPLALGLFFQGPSNDLAERERIIAEATAQQAACRRVLPEIICADDQTQDLEPPALPTHHSARLVWEVFTGQPSQGWQPLTEIDSLARPDVGQVRDDTRALTLDGIVELNLPATTAQTTLGNLLTAQFYVRVRLVAGAFDAPPLLKDIAPNAVRVEQAVPVQQALTIPPHVTPTGSAPLPDTTQWLKLKLAENGLVDALEFIDDVASVPNFPDLFVRDYMPPNAALSQSGQLMLEMVIVGVGSDQPNQSVLLPQAPVQVDSLQLYTHLDNSWQAWSRRDDLDASHRTDFHYVLEATQAEITFGDGEQGRVPENGALIIAVYRATLAENGNLAAHSEFRLSVTSPAAKAVETQLGTAAIVNPITAGDGQAAETLTNAIGRAVATQHAHEQLQVVCAETNCDTFDQLDRQRVLALQPPTQAVNLLDLERLVLAVPGTRIARVRAWAGIHPAYPCLQTPGVVTLVILPDQIRSRPEPSRGLLTAIRRYLDRRRMITTRLELVGPTYLEARVQARVRSHPFTKTDRVRSQILQALDTFLDPRRGGPKGRGWPFGRNVYRSEIMQLIDGVPGVDHVLELTLSAGSGEPQCGNLSLCPTWLATSGAHQIEIMGGR